MWYLNNNNPEKIKFKLFFKYRLNQFFLKRWRSYFKFHCVKMQITINDLAMKGHGEKIIIKAGYTIHGPDGSVDKTGYFKYSHSAITGWRFIWETSAVSWYLTLF